MGTFTVLDGALGEVRASFAEKPSGRLRAMGKRAYDHAILPETSAGRPLSSHPRARGRAVSKSHRRGMKKVEAVELAALLKRFKVEYGDAAARLAEQLTKRYPEITRQGRRTNRTALDNICFIVWCGVRDDDRELIPTLFRAAVLLSAQDDYYDNSQISAAQKDSFCAAINHALRTNSFQPAFERTLQLAELTSLWADIAGTIPRSTPEVGSYWIEKACQLNDAMAAENRAVKRATITYDGYMSAAIHSIGMVFTWATYLAHKHVPVTMLREMDPVLLQGARILRWSNDVASCRQRKNEVNAVTLVGGSSPGFRILRLMVQESRAFHQRVEALDLGPDVRGVLLRSLDFLREFNRRFDVHRTLQL